MAYTDIDKPTDYFNTKLYTGNGSTQSITGVGFQPDWVWIKNRSGTKQHHLFDVVRGATKFIESSTTDAEATDTTTLSSFDSDGFTLGNSGKVNGSSVTAVSWNWKAGGTAPAITYVVKVVSDSGNKYRFDDFGTSAVTLDLQEGGTYTFDQSDSSNSGHPLRFSTTSNGTHGGGSEYTTGVTTTGTPGNAGAKTVITVGSGVATLYYYCSSHSAMGGQANTNSTFGSSNFSGSIQSTVSANTTAGFSIVSFTGNGSSDQQVGHGLATTPTCYITKDRTNGSTNWHYHTTQIDGGMDFGKLNSTDAFSSSSLSAPSSTTIRVGGTINTSSANFISYVFSEKKGYSKFGSYLANGNADGSYIHLGFRPAWILLKASNNGSWNWRLSDSTRTTFNSSTHHNLFPSSSDAEVSNEKDLDYLSNGFKLRTSGSGVNASGYEVIYMAFAESPFVNSNGVPTNAR